MPRVIDRLAIPATQRKLEFSRGTATAIPLQPIVWISVTPPQTIQLPSYAFRFPAVVDTGFNQTLIIRDHHLREWAGIDPLALQFFPRERARVRRQHRPFLLADVWLHRNVPNCDIVDPSAAPFCLETYPGILAVSGREPRLPLLGMRSFARNQLKLFFEFPQLGTAFLSIDGPDEV